MMDVHWIRMLTIASDMMDAQVQIEVESTCYRSNHYIDFNVLIFRLKLVASCNLFNVIQKSLLAI